MSENLGTDISQIELQGTGCGMLRAGVCINCAEKTAALIFESGPGKIAIELGRLPRGDRAVPLHAARALARAAHAMRAALGTFMIPVLPRRQYLKTTAGRL